MPCRLPEAVQHIVDSIDEYRARHGDRTGVARLAAYFHVSPRTVTRALRVLNSRGMARSVRGKGIVLTPGGSNSLPAAPSWPDSAAARVAARIEGRIESGVYETRTALPKYSFFTISERIAPRTLARALALLETKGVVHKKGIRWIVGPSQRSPHAVSLRSPYDGPVVLIHMPAHGMWFRIGMGTYISPFYRRFTREIEKYGFRWFMTLRKGGENVLPVARAREDIQRLVRSLGTRYAGTLIHQQPPATGETWEWVRWFSRYKKPVILLDASPKGDVFDRFRERARCAGPVYRLVRDEHRAVALAADACTGLGHRLLGFPRNTHPERGIERISAFCAYIGNENPGVTVISDCAIERDIYTSRHSRLSGRTPWDTPIRYLCPSPLSENAGEKKIRRYSRVRGLEKKSPCLFSLLRKNITALVGWNDFHAFGMYLWLTRAGIGIPRGLSLLSFDNTLELSPFPVSTIDFGEDGLGYKAAHIFIGDIRIRLDDRHGNIATQPKLIDRGSLGPPRKGGLRMHEPPGSTS